MLSKIFLPIVDNLSVDYCLRTSRKEPQTSMKNKEEVIKRGGLRDISPLGDGFKSIPARHGQTPPVLSTGDLLAFPENFVAFKVANEFKS